MSTTRVQELRFPPWAQDPAGLTLELRGLTVDGEPVEVDPRAPQLELSGPWRSAVVRVHVEASAGLCERIVAPDEREEPPLTIVVTVRCDATRLRRGAGQAAWAQTVELDLELNRTELARTVEIGVHALRSTNALNPEPGYAHLAGARVASGRSCTIQVDEPRPGSGRYLELQYKSFNADPQIPHQHRPALYRLELDREDPILYLNADHAELRPILDSKGTRGRRVRLRELLYERVEAGAWTQLLIHVGERLVADGELTYAWQEAVLDRWLPRLYPTLNSAAEGRERLIADFAQLDRLLADIDATLQVQNGLATQALRFVEDLQ
jgi:hypothetical protein